MEAEAEKLKVLQSEVEKQMHMGDAAGKEGFYLIFFLISYNLIHIINHISLFKRGLAPVAGAFPTLEEKVDADNRSIYVGQVNHF